MLAVFYVTTTQDNGVVDSPLPNEPNRVVPISPIIAGSLTEAIYCADQLGGTNTIDFDIGSGSQTIAPAERFLNSGTFPMFPSITCSLTIDGASQPGYSGQPMITLSDANVQTNGDGTGVDCLDVAMAGSVINGLAFSNHVTSIRLVPGASGGLIEGNSISPGGGIEDDSAGGNTIGGTTPAARNVVSSTIVLNTTGTIGDVVEGNYLGVGQSGESFTGAANGILVESQGHTIGGTVAGSGNVIAGERDGIGIYLYSGSSGIVIEGNLIGTNAEGTEGLEINFGGSGGGIEVENATDCTIGGTTAAARNLISDNSNGIAIDSSSGIVVEGNYIGTDITGNLPIGNLDGILVDSGSAITIGGTVAGSGNVVSGNLNQDLEIGGSGTSDVFVAGNLIGSNASGTAALAGSTGVSLDNVGSGITIGGTTAGSGNVIGGSSWIGLTLQASDVLVEGNDIGVTATGLPLGDRSDGVWIFGTGNTIGGTVNGAGNTVAYNEGDGVGILYNSPDNPILGNSIHDNGVAPYLLGIDLNGAGNNLQPAPILTSALVNTTTGITTIAGTLHASANTNFRLEFFSNSNPDSSGHYEGQTYVGSITVTTDANGDATFPDFTTTATLSTPISAGQYLTATATDPSGNTSQFSNATLVRPTFLVTTLNDSGPGSLREAINDVNADPIANGLDQVVFASAVSCGTISLLSPLPALTRNQVTITGPITLNGSSAGAGVDSLVLSGNQDDVVSLTITNFSGAGMIIYGNDAWIVGSTVTHNGADGIDFGPGAQGTTIGGIVAGQGNVVSSNSGNGIVLFGTGTAGNVVEGNFIGTDTSGTQAMGNSGRGVLVYGGASNNTIGGTTAGDRNIISANGEDGVYLTSAGTSGNVIEGNYIGTDVSGTKAMGNGWYGIAVQGQSSQGPPSNDTIGGAATGASNLISANGISGILIDAGATGIVVQGNDIGTSASETTALANANDGVEITSSGNAIGGTITGAGNLIAFNGANGVTVGSNDTDASTSNAVMGNSIYANGKLGIDLGNDGVTLNNSEGHSGPNLFQDFPLLSSAITANGTTTITGSLSGTPGTTDRVEFFSNPAASSSGYGQGQTFLGFVSVPINSSGTASVSITLANAVTIGQFITTTATDPAGDTSEFSADLLVQGATTTVVVSSVNPSVFGQPFTLTATVSPTAVGQSTPTGSVGFFDGTTELGSVLLSDGIAQFGTAALIVGSHSITAQYLGDGNFVGSTSPVVSQIVGQASTTMVLVANPASSVFGQPVTFTATVTADTPGAGTSTGTISFMEGSTTLDTETLGSSTTASFSTSALAVGSATVTAVYSGDGDFVSSSSSTTVTIYQASTITSLTASPTFATSGQPVTLTATITVVAPGAGAPTGSVQFFNGTTTLGTASLSGDTAILTTTTLPVGTDSLTAEYLGDSNFTVSTSSAVSVAIGISTTTTLSSPTNPSVFGQSVTFTAAVAPTSGNGTPTGTVTFYDGSTALGTATLSAGKASLKTASVSIGSQAITAVYGGDSTYASSTSTVLTQTVSQDSTTTKVTSSANPSVYGQAVTLTATVKAASPGSGTPTGTVTFYDGTTSLGSGILSGGTSTLSTAFVIIGSQSITAVYSGDLDFTGSTSSALTQTVNQDNTTTSEASSTNPSVYGQAVTFTATVSATAPGTETPTGTVTFSVGSTSLGTAMLSGNVATFTTSSPLAAGNDIIKATYSGDTDYKTSTGTLAQTVSQDSTTSSLVSSANPSVYGQPVTFTATVAANAPGSGTPTGSVTFTDGSIALATVTLSSGAASYSTTKLLTDQESIFVTYNGSTSFLTSSASLSQTVNQDGTTSSLVSSANPSVYGQSVTFTATVSANSPGAGTPTGTVTFYDGSTAIGTGTLSGGKTTLKTNSLPTGSDVITVVYSGDANFTTTTSASLTQTVGQDATTTKLTSSASPSVYGQSVIFTATVIASAPGGGAPTGTVTFMDGTTAIGTGTLGGGTATFTTSLLAVASHTITAVYSSDSNFMASTSSALTQKVNQSSTTTALVSSVNPSIVGLPVTFTATVTATSPGSGTPTGSVTFYINSKSVGTVSLTGGAASCTTTFTLAGTDTIKVVYGGDTNFKTSTSANLSQVVQSTDDSDRSGPRRTPGRLIIGQSGEWPGHRASVGWRKPLAKVRSHHPAIISRVDVEDGPTIHRIVRPTESQERSNE